MNARLTVRTACLAAWVALGACGEGGGGPTTPGQDSIPAGPADAVLSLASSAADGAILLRVTGPGMGAPAVTDSTRVLHWRLASDTELVVVVFGILVNGELLRMEIPDGRQIERYVGTVIEVAGKTDTLRADLSGYTLRLAVAR
jgi:hypothetical protein